MNTKIKYIKWLRRQVWLYKQNVGLTPYKRQKLEELPRWKEILEMTDSQWESQLTEGELP